MARPPSETRQRIQDVARELFTEKGVQRTSLQDIATRLGITKPALYYHFSSREDLVRSILQPLIDEGESFVAEHERKRGSARADLVLIVEELTTLADLGLIDAMLAWRERLCKLVFGRRPTLRQSTRAVIAFGGLQDCCLQFPDVPYGQLRSATVDGAMAALAMVEA